MTAKSSPEAPSSEVIAGVTVKPRPSGEGAGRALARPRRRSRRGPGGSGRPAAPGCRCGPRGCRRCGSRSADRSPDRSAGSTATEVRPEPEMAGSSARPGTSRSLLLQRPELREQRARRRLQQRRDVDVVGAEAHAVAAERRRAPPGRGRAPPRAHRGARGCRGSPPAGRRCRAPCRSAPGPAARSISGFSSVADVGGEPGGKARSRPGRAAARKAARRRG